MPLRKFQSAFSPGSLLQDRPGRTGGWVTCRWIGARQARLARPPAGCFYSRTRSSSYPTWSSLSRRWCYPKLRKLNAPRAQPPRQPWVLGHSVRVPSISACDGLHLGAAYANRACDTIYARVQGDLTTLSFVLTIASSCLCSSQCPLGMAW